jgi:hypothetical protein
VSVRLTWYGDALKKRLDEAQRLGIDITTHAAVTPAKQFVRIKTRILQGSIQARPAAKEGGRWVGRWGSFDVNYALWQEIKTFSQAGHRPYLRPAAEIEYPKLAGRIKAFWERGGG